MILQCPSCNARFLVPDAAVPAEGRTVKCGKCAHQWFTTRDPDAPAALAEPDFAAMAHAAAQEAMPSDPTAAPPARITRRWRLDVPIWPLRIAAPVLAVMWVVMALFAYFPGGQTSMLFGGLYRALGATDTRDLVFDAVVMERSTNGARTKFLLSGSIANQGAEPRLLPRARVQLKDADGKVVWSRQYPVDTVIQPGEVYPFRIEDVETTFAGRATTIVMDIGNNFELMMR